MPTRESLADLGSRIIQSAPPDKRSQYGNPLSEGFNNICFRLEEINAALDSHYFKGNYLTGVGKTEWAGIKWNDQSIAEKKNIINQADFVFTSAATASECLEARKSLKASNVNDRILDCSDAHHSSDSNQKDRIGKCFTWIKADTTFLGLKQTFIEPDERIYIGEMPDKIAAVNGNKTKYIKSIRIKKKAGAVLDEHWFDTDLDLNSALVAIIGNKGNGKSALTDVLGFLGDTKNNHAFSFLSDQKFARPTDNKAKHFEATLVWESGATTTKSLDENNNLGSVEMVKYIPQSFFERVCNEMISGETTDFDRELRKVIFSHVAEADRLGLDSLDDLIAYKTSETNKAITTLRTEMQQLNKDIVGIEAQLTTTFRESIKNHVAVKKEELAAFDKSKPEPVLPPDTEGQQEQTLQTSLAIIETEARVATVSMQIQKVTERQKKVAIQLASASKVLQKIQDFQQEFETFRQDCSEEMSALALDFDSVVALHVDDSSLVAKRNFLQRQRERIDTLLDSGNTNGLLSRREALQEERTTLQSILDEPNRKYQEYRSSLADWEIKRNEIVGDSTTTGSLKFYVRQLEDLSGFPAKLTGLQTRRVELSTKLYTRTRELANIYSELYKPVQHFIETHPLAKNQLSLRPKFYSCLVRTAGYSRSIEGDLDDFGGKCGA